MYAVKPAADAYSSAPTFQYETSRARVVKETDLK